MKQLTLLLLLLQNLAFAQVNQKQTPSQFDKFINGLEIEWASYLYSPVKFEKPNLNILLLSKLNKAAIKASFPLFYNHDPIKYITKDSIDIMTRISSCTLSVPIFDSLGNLMETPVTKDTVKIDTAFFVTTDITEILYIEKGQLKSYIPWVSPMRPIVTSMGVFLGGSDYFSTCFNFDHTNLSSKQNKTAFLTQTNRKIVLDSMRQDLKLKELYGRNLLQTLWPYILRNKFEIVSLSTNKKINQKELTGDLIGNMDITVPMYDSLGNISGSSTIKQELGPGNFTTAELIQDWYYDHTKNIVFNKIRELNLYAKKQTVDGQDKEPSPILKIVFK